jgi:NADPH-dependent curcumin reductase CurA
MAIAAREIRLKSRPAGLPGPDNFELATRVLPEPAPGELLVKTQWMSVDPYMRGRMADRPSYIAPFRIGEPLEGAALGVVQQSADDRFKPGDVISHFSGWRDHALVDASKALKIDSAAAPAPAWLGPLGVPGFTAWVGLGRITALKEGETVFVSAGAGAVGSMAVQIAKLRGARVIASAGSEEKVRWLRDELGADAVINYRTADSLTKALAAAAPAGIDVYFDNVGGGHLEAALANARNFARFAICGMIAGYNDAKPSPGPGNLAEIVIKRLDLKGYIVLDHYDLLSQFTAEMTGWIADGRIKWRDTVIDGLENAPGAFLGLFSGDNVGKMLVKLTN